MNTLKDKSIKTQQDVVRANAGSPFRSGSFSKSLRVRIALGVALPVLIVLSLLSLTHYWRGRQLLEDQIQLTTLRLSEMIRGSLRHAMLDNDSQMLSQILSSMAGMENIRRVQIINPDGRVMVDTANREQGAIRHSDDLGCRECHRFPAESRPRATKLSTQAGLLRIAAPIPNEPDCAGCHPQQDSHLGMVLAEVSFIDVEEHLRNHLRLDLTVSVGITLLVTLAIYLLIHWLVVRRVEAFRLPLARFAAGNFTSRLPSSPLPTDELGELANTFNHMADELNRRTQEKEERSKLRQQAIVEERGRIARELHDGLAQLLGYVNTKAMAVRLMLKNNQTEAADQHLLQLEEAARELLVDVRQAILDLKMVEQNKANLTATLKELTAQFTRLSGLPVELILSPAVEDLSLDGETELQLLRIVQESLTNVRKHASATQVTIKLRIDRCALELTISDNGRGFDPNRVQTNHLPRLGLGTMRERAEAINARFNLDSNPGNGTRVIVHLPLKES